MNVKMGKRQSAKKGNVAFSYASFLGYRRGTDGKPEIVPDEAEIIKRIYNSYIAGESLNDIAKALTADGILTPRGNAKWSGKGVLSILSNEKYKGDALLQKTYIADCITKKSKRNNGELPQYYVENNHPAIIERQMFDRVQEEIARRAGKRKVKEVGTKTEQGKYSSKYALTDLLFCGTCGTPYRRCTWSKKGKIKIVWRCISRLDYGTKYCKESPSIEESVIHDAVIKAITQKAMSEGANTDRILHHIQKYEASLDTDSIFAMRQKLYDITAQLDKLTKMDVEAVQNGDFDKQLETMYGEMYAIKDKIADQENEQKEIQTASDKLQETAQAIENIKGIAVEYDDKIVRQLIECIKVISINRLDIFFKDGTKTEMHI